MRPSEKEIDRLDEMAAQINHQLSTCVMLAGGDVYLETDLKKVLHDFSYYRNEATRLIRDANQKG